MEIDMHKIGAVPKLDIELSVPLLEPPPLLLDSGISVILRVPFLTG
jgi:hypothetical protein